MFSIETQYADNDPYQIILRISLKYPDWCVFETTPVYQALKAYFEYGQTPHSINEAQMEAMQSETTGS